ncbi:AAA family ATPase, partial [Chromobacterium haemolyticum]|uniref:AAA family ATPase n=1 Tax=Chromobacterium haemolyticum TaxID=394935 RepID=UPI0012FBD137
MNRLPQFFAKSAGATIMIHTFSARNFTSFYEPLELDFRIGKAVPEDYLTFKSSSGSRLSSAMVTIGHNASGKSNVLKSIVTLCNIAAYSFHALPDEPLVYEPHSFHQDEPTSFQIDFETPSGSIYRYNLTYDSSTIYYESLK